MLRSHFTYALIFLQSIQILSEESAFDIYWLQITYVDCLSLVVIQSKNTVSKNSSVDLENCDLFADECLWLPRCRYCTITKDLLLIQVDNAILKFKLIM